MKLAADFRALAREALEGRWRVAVLTGFVASLIGAEIAGGGGSSSGNSDDSSITLNLQNIVDVDLWMKIRQMVVLLGAVLVIWLLVTLFIGGAGKLGYAKFNLNLVDRGNPAFETLFGYFSYWKTTAVSKLLQSVYVLLWSLLFIIPGIVATYSYAMTEFILAEHPELTASEAIAQSKEMMSGNRWRLFCLHFSFIGWDILSSLTLGIGNLWLRPYKQAANAAFYREISGTGYAAFDPS